MWWPSHTVIHALYIYAIISVISDLIFNQDPIYLIKPFNSILIENMVDEVVEGVVEGVVTRKF